MISGERPRVKRMTSHLKMLARLQMADGGALCRISGTPTLNVCDFGDLLLHMIVILHGK